MTPPPLPENSQFRPQKYLAKLEKIKSQLLAASELLADHGCVIATWRNYGNMRMGPYYRVRYYDNGARRSIYLGRSEELAQVVRNLLIKLQYARSTRRLRTKIRKSLRLEKLRLQNYLKSYGYYLKGFEFRKLK
jgi:hypothetical protein